MQLRDRVDVPGCHLRGGFDRRDQTGIRRDHDLFYVVGERAREAEVADVERWAEIRRLHGSRVQAPSSLRQRRPDAHAGRCGAQRSSSSGKGRGVEAAWQPEAAGVASRLHIRTMRGRST